MKHIKSGSIRTVSNDGAKQILMAYRGRKDAAVEKGFEFKPGYIYCAVRAISSRINQNFDAWPSGELKKSYKSFIGKPIFVNHNNSDPTKARGKVVAARYVEAGDDKYVETVMEVDGQRFPKLAHELKTGGLDSVSMGVEAGHTRCSMPSCRKLAHDESEFCDHVKYHKGQKVYDYKTGKKHLIWEDCHKLGFFELSFVFDPADESAMVSRVIAANSKFAVEQPPMDEMQEGQMPYGQMPNDPIGMPTDQMSPSMMPNASRRDIEAQIHRLAYGEVTAPEDVDTLRENNDDDDTDDFKHWIESPKELKGPNLDATERLDREQQDEGLDDDRRVEHIEDVKGVPMPSRNARRRRHIAEADSDLIEDAEEQLATADAESQGDYSDEPGSNAGGTDDDYSDEDLHGDPDDEDEDEDEDDYPRDGDDDLPPWLADMAGGGGQDDGGPPPPPEREARTRKEAPMGLAQRSRIAARGRVRHYADDSGHADGGPYHIDDNDEGEQEDVYISQVPGKEQIADPGPGDGQISNTENNLVASLQRRIRARNSDLKRDLIAYEQITGRRIASTQRHAEDDLPNLPDESQVATKTPDQVDPTVADPAGEAQTGDSFDSVALDGGNQAQTQPKDASVRVFRAFDNWLRQTTGRTASQHGNSSFIRRSAARFCQASGVSVESLFPTLGVVLRQARKSEQRRNAMRRRADEKLDVAAPQDRTDVETPVSDTTDADAQASQFDLGDFGNNAGDDIADPDLSTNSQIWAPGEDPSPNNNKTSNRKADGITAVRYAEAFIGAGLAPNTSEEKWKIAGLAQTMRHGTIVDRIRLLDAVNSTRQAVRRTAARSAPQSLPQGLGQRQLTAGTTRVAANDDYSSDSALFFKG